MRKLLLLLFCVTGLNAQTMLRNYESISVDSVLRMDSLATTPGVTSADSKPRLFWKAGGDGLIHFYRLYRGTVKMIDSSYAFTDTARAFTRIATMAWENISATDSIIKILVPSGRTITIDSIYSIRVGGTSASFNVKKVVSGTPTDLLSANASIGTSVAGATGMQNNTSLAAYTQIWICLRAVSGTLTQVWFEIVYRYVG